MISEGSRDARKRLELGFGDIGNGGGRDMEDTEVEEGEACSNENDEDYDARVDPDVALSYIDVKIQDVLGHLQKDFETEVSVETLGRKFGGYGSFLSAQQRSPSWSQPKIMSCNIPRSPNLMEPEGSRGNPVVYSTVSQTVRHGTNSSSSMGMPATKALSTNNSNGEVCSHATQPGSFTSIPETLSKKAYRMLDQKPLKVRIKMGRGKLPTQKNAAIYSGLGLDVSPSLSNDSQFENKGISQKSGDGPFDSPTSILQIMTSFPPLLSPLADDLVYFAGKGTCTSDKTVHASWNNLENSDASARDSDCVEGDRQLPVKKMKLKPRIGDGVITKGTETRIPNCEEIVSKTLKLPFVSISNADTDDSSRSTDRPFDNNFNDLSEKETRKAVLVLHQIPVLEGQNNLPSIYGSIMEGGTVSSVQHPDQYTKDWRLQEIPVVKKNPGVEPLNAANKDGSENLSTFKNLQPSLRSGSFNDDTNRSPTHSGSSFHKQTMYNDLAGEKHKQKKKSRGKLWGEDVAKSWKVEHRLDSSQDASGTNKESKSEKMNASDAEQKSDHSGALLKVHRSSSNNVRTASSSKDQLRYKDKSSSMDSKLDMKERRQVAVEKRRDVNMGACNEGFLDMGNDNSKDIIGKRNFEEHQDAQTFIGSIQNTDHQHQEIGVSVQEIFSENDCSRVKKARLSNPENKESSTNKGNDRTDKKGSHEIDNGLKQALDGTDCVKMDSASIKDPAAATSIFSKVSGSNRTKVSFQEVKGSPVESVSSSPTRISNLDKLALSNKEQIGKGESNSGLRRCSDGEDDGKSDRSATIRKQKNPKSSPADFWEKDISLSGFKSKIHIAASQIGGGGVNDVGQHTPLPKPQVLGKCEVEDRPESSNYNDAPHSGKSGKGFSSRLKEKNRNFRPDSDAEKIKSFDQLQDHSPSHETKYVDVKTRSQDMFGIKPDGNENKTSSKRDFAGKLSDDSTVRKKQLNNNEHEYCDVRRDATSTSIQNLLVDSDGEKSSRGLLSGKSEQVNQVSGKGKLLPLVPSGGTQNEAPPHYPQPVSGSHQVNGDAEHDASKLDDKSKLRKKQSRKADNQNGTQLVSSMKPISNEHGTKELYAPSVIRRDSSAYAANNALKEAKDFKHLADRLKNSGSSESTGYYFEAALKFLHGASLLEYTNNGNAKYNEMAQSKQVYRSTAKLCEFCAHEYERAKDMGAAALAYKCMEVAYMRVIYSSHGSACRDRHDLQTALQVAPLGESPSSSSSDVDNVNNSGATDKAARPKDDSSPHVSGTHTVSAQNRPSVLRLLNFTQDVNFAMEASRRSRNAFAIINAIPVETKNAEGISSIKKALDFNFLDVEGLLKLVRLAMEAINR